MVCPSRCPRRYISETNSATCAALNSCWWVSVFCHGGIVAGRLKQRLFNSAVWWNCTLILPNMLQIFYFAYKGIKKWWWLVKALLSSKHALRPSAKGGPQVAWMLQAYSGRSGKGAFIKYVCKHFGIFDPPCPHFMQPISTVRPQNLAIGGPLVVFVHVPCWLFWVGTRSSKFPQVISTHRGPFPTKADGMATRVAESSYVRFWHHTRALLFSY